MAFFLVRAPSEQDWTVDGVAALAADEVLDHWSFWAESWVGRPEFKGTIYEGSFSKPVYRLLVIEI